jgi:phospholipid transport system substrate-binding protein
MPAVTRTFLMAVLIALAPHASAADSVDPAAERPIERLYDELLEAMHEAERLGVEGRAEKLRPVLGEVYDLPFMAEKTLGAGWTRLSPDEQERWIAAFSRLTVSTYAHRFGPWAGERFEILGVEPSARGTVLVRTRVIPAKEDSIALDYRMQDRDGSWRIVDVFLNGTVSELALRRSEYSSVLRREGFSELLRSIEERILDPGEDPRR